MTLNAEQRVRNIRTKVRLISDRIWRYEGWGVCTGDLEQAFILREMDLLAGLTPDPLPEEAVRALGRIPQMPRPEGQHTKDYLADELEKAGLAEMAARAREGYYHDFLSPLDFPELTLDRDLSNAGTPEALALRKRHREGEFDASREESEEWAKSPEGKVAMELLMRPYKRDRSK